MEITNGTHVGAVAALIAAFDAHDEASGERIGGPDEVASDVLRALEVRILASRADAPHALAWKVGRLARCVALRCERLERVGHANDCALDRERSSNVDDVSI